MKPVDVKPSTYIDFDKKITKKIFKLKLVIMKEYLNIKIYLPNAMFQIGLKKLLRAKNLKALCRGHMLLVIVTEKKLLERFTKKITKNKSKSI